MCSNGGPSPLARGKLRRCRARRTRPTDHPRSRGGNVCRNKNCKSLQGPSPLARGKLQRRHAVNSGRGTIPARAGETKSQRHTSSPVRDHPRSRGGNSGPAISTPSLSGPSPLARGKRPDLGPRVCQRGTIPARAGETYRRGWRCRGVWDHPRSRGGNSPNGFPLMLLTGPSPLARGKRVAVAQGLQRLGTIPARAGETGRKRLREQATPDHPRSRGGNSSVSGIAPERTGPSPLARGKRSTAGFPVSAVGTIPARAGETGTRRATSEPARDHPRSRGGNPSRTTLMMAVMGPSPLARGKPKRPCA